MGKVLRSAGFIVTVAATAYQFNPAGVTGWTSLNPKYVDAVMVQWYEG